MLSSSDNVDPALQSLVCDISTGPDDRLPQTVAKLRDMMDKISVEPSSELERLKQDLYGAGVLQCCSAALRYTYESKAGGYQTAAQMAELVSTCCVGFTPVQNKDVFYQKLLPSVADNLTYLANCVLDSVESSSSQMICQFGKIMDAILLLLKGQSQLIPHVLQSKQYENIQLSDNDEIGGVLLLFLEKLTKSNGTFLSDIGSETVDNLLDDIVYKLGYSNNPHTGGAAIKTLLLIVREHGSIAESIPDKYPGLDTLLRKSWQGKGYDTDLKELLSLLYSNAKQQVFSLDISEKKTKAACVIQATWRAYLIRKRMKKLPKAVSTLQRSFRERKRQQKLVCEKKRVEEELRLQVRLRRLRALREFHQKQLCLLEIVPANQMDQYLSEVERRAAVVIQQVWRGHRVRKSFQQQKQALQQCRAAVIIQRAVLRFLKRRRAVRKSLSPWRWPKGLNDARRTELRLQVEEYISVNRSSSLSQESCKELHAHAQDMLHHYLLKREADHRADQHRDALLAQINTDIELLMNAPSLEASTATDLDLYRSRSGHVAAAAKQVHATMSQSLRHPWWKKLRDDLSHPEPSMKDDLNNELDTLYLGGTK